MAEVQWPTGANVLQLSKHAANSQMLQIQEHKNKDKKNATDKCHKRNMLQLHKLHKSKSLQTHKQMQKKDRDTRQLGEPTVLTSRMPILNVATFWEGE